MSADDTFNGWANRETWAVALHVDNDEGWLNSVLDALREYILQVTDNPETSTIPAWRAGEIVQENVEGALDVYGYNGSSERWALETLHDIGSLYRVDWRALGAYYLADLEEVTS